MKVALLKIILRFRWAYFHVHPGYTKVWMSAKEAHFFHAKTNTLHCDYRVAAQEKA